MKLYIIVIYVALFQLSCSKQDEFLDKKSSLADVTPTTLADFQAILDHTDVMNNTSQDIVGTDNYYVSDANFAAASVSDRNTYIWAPDILQGSSTNFIPWQNPYITISYANIVLDGISKINLTNENKLSFENVKGSALFFRAFAFHKLVQLFTKQYIASSATTDLGIPLRTTSDVNVIFQRASLKETYDRIISDLKEALSLLPTNPVFKTRPSKMAAEALLARAYLSMNDYSNALQSSNIVLQGNGVSLIDLNSLSTTASVPFPTIKNGNPEVLFYAESLSNGIILNPRLFVDTTLYRSYASNDLRRTIYYTVQSNGSILYKGYLTGILNTWFGGVAYNELYFIRAEANARLGNTQDAISDLNTVLRARWRNGTFVPLTASSSAQALQLVITERNKDMPFMGRWQELKRLNLEPAFEKTLKRKIAGIEYILPPNDNRYALPISPNEILLSGLIQNPR